MRHTFSDTHTCPWADKYSFVLAAVSLTMVCPVDFFEGSQNGIRVDVTNGAGASYMGLLCLQNLEKTAGDAIAAIAAFAVQSLGGNVPPGVHFPEEIDCPTYG